MTIPSSASAPRPRRQRADASERILRATARVIVQSGAVALTMHDVAEEAGVSKGLIHYHFHDKETLLARLVEWMTRNLVAREQDAIANSAPRDAIDDLWKWLSSELERGHIRVLNELAEWRGDLVRREIQDAATGRREAAARTIDGLFTLLSLRPRIPLPLMADVIVPFIDGLAVSTGVAPDSNPRAAFDVLWLAMLSLAE